MVQIPAVLDLPTVVADQRQEITNRRLGPKHVAGADVAKQGELGAALERFPLMGVYQRVALGKDLVCAAAFGLHEV